jgi:endonuclease YncB( thermonuclease family)
MGKIMTKLVMLSLMSWLSVVPAETLTIEQSDIKYIYDADTFYLHCQQGFKCKKQKLGIRVMGVDTAEIKGKCQGEKRLARQAKQFAVEKIRAAQSIELVINPRKRYERWGRLLAWVKLDGHDLAEMLIAANLGRVYHGKKRKGWCK